MDFEKALGRQVTSFGMQLEGGFDLYYGQGYDDGESFVGLSRSNGWTAEYVIMEKADTAQEAFEIAVAYLNPEGSRD